MPKLRKDLNDGDLLTVSEFACFVYWKQQA